MSDLRAEPMATHAEEIARAFHETYERRAPAYGYKTREESAVPWEDVHPRLKSLMVSTVHELLDRGVIAHDSEGSSDAGARVELGTLPLCSLCGKPLDLPMGLHDSYGLPCECDAEDGEVIEGVVYVEPASPQPQGGSDAE